MTATAFAMLLRLALSRRGLMSGVIRIRKEDYFFTLSQRGLIRNLSVLRLGPLSRPYGRVLRVFQNEKHGGLLRFFFMFIQTPCSHTMFYLTFRCFFAIINNDKSSGYLLDRKGYFMYILRLFYMPEKTVVLPLAHSDVLQGIFYSFLSADPTLAKEIHDKPPQNGKQYKFFCFSDFRGRHAVRDGRLYFEGPFSWELRSADERILKAAEACAETICVKGVNCRLVSAERLSRTCFSDSVEITMVTPLAVYETRTNGYRRFFSPDEEEFCRNTEKNLICKYEAFYGAQPDGPVSLEPVSVKPKDKCVTKYKGWYLTGYYGRYRLRAPKKVIDFAYHTGLGVKNSAGFGLFQF